MGWEDRAEGDGKERRGEERSSQKGARKKVRKGAWE